MNARKFEELIAELDRAVEDFGERLREEVISESMRWLKELDRRVAEAEALATQVRQKAAAVVATRPSVSPPPPVARPAPTTLELPQPLTIRTLDQYLRNLGFTVKNNRSSGSSGAYWVLDDGKKFRPIMEALKARGVRCQFKARRKMYAGPSFWVDLDEVLPE